MFTLSPCSRALPDVAECKDASACFQPADGGSPASLGSVDTRNISSGAAMSVPVQASFSNGSPCKTRKLSTLC